MRGAGQRVVVLGGVRMALPCTPWEAVGPGSRFTKTHEGGRDAPRGRAHRELENVSHEAAPGPHQKWR